MPGNCAAVAAAGETPLDKHRLAVSTPSKALSKDRTTRPPRPPAHKATSTRHHGKCARTTQCETRHVDGSPDRMAVINMGHREFDSKFQTLSRERTTGTSKGPTCLAVLSNS